MQYNYDTNGSYNFFLLTFISIVLIPWTLSELATALSRRVSKLPTYCAPWNSKHPSVKLSVPSWRQRNLKKKHLFMALGWLAFAWTAYKSANFVQDIELYDPFKILGISSSMAEKDIKRHYKKLSIKFHPDKIKLAENQTMEEANEKFVEYTKAYKALTDETIRKNFELYGHPDGKQEFSAGIAIPGWMVEGQYSYLVLAFYGLLFGAALPYFVGKWWYGSRRLTKDAVLTDSASTFFLNLTEQSTIPELIEMLAAASEFHPHNGKKEAGVYIRDTKELRSLKDKVAGVLNSVTGQKLEGPLYSASAHTKSVATLIYAHLLRVEIKDKSLLREKNAVIVKASHLVRGLFSVSLAHSWLSTTINIIKLQQYITQAFHPLMSPLLQLPHVTVETTKQANNEGIRDITDLVKASNTQVNKALQSLGQQERDYAMQVAKCWPTLEVVDARFKVAGDDIITPGAIVQLIVKIRVNHAAGNITSPLDPKKMDFEDEDAADLDDLLGKKSNGRNGEVTCGYAHTPYFPHNRKPLWLLFVGDHKLNRIFVQPAPHTDIEFVSETGDSKGKIRTLRATFQAPGGVGLYTFKTYVMSDWCIGSDCGVYMQMKVEEAPPAPAAADIADDISEPDEDTIAGALAAARGQPTKKRDDSDEEYSSDEDDLEASSDSSSDSDSD